MATAAPTAAQNGTWLRPKTALFGFIAAMIAYVVWHNESFLLQPQHPVWQHYQSFKWWLLPHGIAGASAILLGPMQFSDKLRRKYARLHRVMGRIYVAGALVAAPLGAYIQFFEERIGGPRSFSIAATADAVLLMATTAIAFSFILKGNVQKHRQWMTRSFAVALVFVEVRVIGGLTGWDRNPANIETIVWTCLVFAVFVADIVLQLQEVRRTPAPQVKAQAAS